MNCGRGRMEGKKEGQEEESSRVYQFSYFYITLCGRIADRWDPWLCSVLVEISAGCCGLVSNDCDLCDDELIYQLFMENACLKFGVRRQERDPAYLVVFTVRCKDLSTLWSKYGNRSLLCTTFGIFSENIH